MKIPALVLFIGLICSAAYAQEPMDEFVSPPEPVINVELAGGLLSVGLENAPFGKVMTEIANRAGFEVEIAKSIGAKTLTTRFEGIDLKRGILRILSLIGQRTYFMHYDKQGAIKKIEVYATSAAPKKRPQTQRKAVRRAVPGIQPLEPTLLPGGAEERGPEAPYIPPQEAPVFIPPPPAGK